MAKVKCEKQPYYSYSAAVRAMLKDHNSVPVLKAYRCRHCRRWHLDPHWRDPPKRKKW